MSVLLPPTGAQTLSQALAAVEDRNLIESILWEKVSALCSEAGLPLDGEAPDYIVAPTSPPPMGVFQINQDLQSGTAQSAGFLPSDEEVLEMIQQAQEAAKNKQPDPDEQKKLAGARLDNVRADQIEAEVNGTTAASQLEGYALMAENKAKAYGT